MTKPSPDIEALRRAEAEADQALAVALKAVERANEVLSRAREACKQAYKARVKAENQAEAKKS
jgi:hypothetical protein